MVSCFQQQFQFCVTNAEPNFPRYKRGGEEVTNDEPNPPRCKRGGEERENKKLYLL